MNSVLLILAQHRREPAIKAKPGSADKSPVFGVEDSFASMSEGNIAV